MRRSWKGIWTLSRHNRLDPSNNNPVRLRRLSSSIPLSTSSSDAVETNATAKSNSNSSSRHDARSRIPSLVSEVKRMEQAGFHGRVAVAAGRPFSSTALSSEDNSDSMVSSCESSIHSSHSNSPLSPSSLAEVSFSPSSSTEAWEEFIQTSTYPSRALKLLEQEGHGMASEMQRELLLMVTRSKNPQLLERATKLDFSDSECRRLLIAGWAETSKQPSTSEYNSQRVVNGSQNNNKNGRSKAYGQEKFSLTRKTGAVRAAHLLQDWCHESSSQSVNSSSPPPLSSFRTVLTALSEESNYQLSGTILQQLFQTPGIAPDRDCFHRVLQACSNAGALQPALNCLRVMRVAAAPTDTSLSTNTDGAAASLGSSVDTLTVAPRNQKDNEPTLSTYKIVLQAHVNAIAKQSTQNLPTRKSIGEAAFQFIRKMPMEPDTTCYNITLNALALEGNYELAQDLFLNFLKLQIDVEENIGIQQESDIVDNNESTEAAFDDAIDDNGRHSATSNCTLLTPRSSTSTPSLANMDPIPLRTLLKAYAKANTMEAAERAEEFLSTLKPVLSLDARSYTTVVAMWCKLGEPQRARKLLGELISMYWEAGGDPRWQPDAISFRTVIGALSKVQKNQSRQRTKECASQAQELLTVMHARMGLNPNLITCNTVLNCWAQAQEPEAAEEFLQQMIHWDIQPDIVSYNTILFCHAKLGNASECIRWLQRLVRAAVESDRSENRQVPIPNTRTITAVISAISKEGTTQAAEEAEAWLIQMQDWHKEHGWECQPNLFTFNAVLSSWARAGNGTRAEYLLRQFQEYSPSSEQPNTISFNAIIQAYGRGKIDQKGLFQRAQNLLEEMMALGWQPNDQTVRAVKMCLEKDTSLDSREKQHQWEVVQQRFFYYVPSLSASSKKRARWNAKRGSHLKTRGIKNQSDHSREESQR